ncbi:hypothetical protein OUZ56_012929 [Daphnia magna]|uniref:Uncharacterized protein n=1 Tax=Daphnia magna TaxID=35525 RepID=A0ABQ9Z4F9_9CRUS|nr:hypothetical protein OUZ56_012929 [Daphnia magna]
MFRCRPRHLINSSFCPKASSTPSASTGGAKTITYAALSITAPPGDDSGGDKKFSGVFNEGSSAPADGAAVITKVFGRTRWRAVLMDTHRHRVRLPGDDSEREGYACCGDRHQTMLK